MSLQDAGDLHLNSFLSVVPLCEYSSGVNFIHAVFTGISLRSRSKNSPMIYWIDFRYWNCLWEEKFELCTSCSVVQCGPSSDSKLQPTQVL